MRTEYFITMDTHCRTTDACIKTAGGKLVRREHSATGIPQLRELIESVPRPRRVAFEEGTLAGWLYRNLQNVADELLVCDPRRNGYIAKDGDSCFQRPGFIRPLKFGRHGSRVRLTLGQGAKKAVISPAET